MKKILLSGILLITITSAFSQKISKNDFEGLWTENNTWEAGVAPGVANLSDNEDITIQGYISRGTYPAPTPGSFTALQFRSDREAYDLTISDTLVVYGDVIFDNKAMNLVIENGGVLIVIGDLTVDNMIEINTEGVLAVSGTFIRNQGNTKHATYSGSGDVYAGEYKGTAAAIIDGDGNDNSKTINQLSDDGFTTIEDFIGNNGEGSLPIELKSFEASKSGQNINLNWVTAKEENFSHFEIERSLDQDNWSQIGLVQGLGESMSDVNYDFTDRNAPFGVIYYRLNAVDIDASFEYSPVVKIEVGFEGKLAVSPNPVKDASNLKIKVPTEFRDNLAYVGLFDLSGVKVQEFRDFNTDGNLQINQRLKSGMYILKVNHNGLQENIRVVVQ